MSRLCVVGKQVHRAVTVGDEVYLIANPHRDYVLCHIVGDVLYGLGCRVVDPNIVGHASAVILPVAELSHHAVVSKFFPVRRIGTESAFGQGDGGRHSTFGRHCPQFPFKSTADAIAVHDALAVGLPCHDDVVGPHAVAEVIT